MGKEKIKTEGCKLLLCAFKFVGITKRNRIPNNRSVSNWRLTRVKYNTYRQSREEQENVKLQIRFNNLIHFCYLKHLTVLYIFTEIQTIIINNSTYWKPTSVMWSDLNTRTVSRKMNIKTTKYAKNIVGKYVWVLRRRTSLHFCFSSGGNSFHDFDTVLS